VDHAELFVKIARLDLGRHVLGLVVHHPVLLYEVALEKLNHLKSDKETDRDEVHQKNEPDND